MFYWGNGSSFEGNFENGEMNGAGLRRWPDGSTYSGQFRRGEMSGEGVVRQGCTRPYLLDIANFYSFYY